VCAQQAAWLAQQVEIVPVAINLSTLQFKRGNVLRTIDNAIVRHQLKHQYIELELTESAVMDDPEEAAFNMQRLKKLGVKLSLDDFGTGYSSLAHLKHFPFDFVKIDRSFVTNITSSKEDAALVNAIIVMAHGLNLRVVAEGVETKGQLDHLSKQGCDELQGYYFSRPVPAEEFAAMLREHKRLIFAKKLGVKKPGRGVHPRKNAQQPNA
jgi:EAL domain-containing protein (putative c-di-GMP-specific phosphodiesterase class I)